MHYLRLLFWLKWKLMWRGYRRSTSAVVGALLMLVFFLPFSFGIAIGCGAGFLNLAPPFNGHLLRGVLLGIYVFWLLAPLLGYQLNESYDITRLFVYPLSVRQIFTGAILGSLLDVPTLLLLPTLLAVLIGFTHDSLALLLILLAVGLFLFHTLSLSQAVILASTGFLRSRRFRDWIAILVPVLMILYYISTQLLVRRASSIDLSRFLQSDLWKATDYLPTGFAARAVIAASQGEYLPALGALLGLLVFVVATVYLASWLIQKVYAGDVVSPSVRRRPEPAARVSGTASVWHRSFFLGGSLPPVVQAMIDKEIRYMFRDPYFKIVLANLVYMLVVAIFAFLNPIGHNGIRQLGPGMIWGATGFVLLLEMQLVCNIFGTEGGAANLLFLFPCPRRQILLGKNLTLFTALSIVNLVFMAIMAAMDQMLSLFGLLFCWMELALIIFIAIGNLASIYFPYRLVMRGWRIRQQSASRGFGYTFLYMGLMLIAFVILSPVLAGLLFPTLDWIPSGWLAVTVPLAILYAIGLYLLSLRLAVPLLTQREQQIIDKVSQTEE